MRRSEAKPIAPFAAHRALHDESRIGETGTQELIAEMDVDMSQFPPSAT